jgi:HAD superfamily hydrolase (TIGR01490 family)
MSARYVVFADVDETLIRYKSMVAFMEYLLFRAPFAARPIAEEKRREAAALKAVHSPEGDRAALSRRYYEIFRGVSREELERAALDWLGRVTARDDFFIPATFRELSEHKAAGAELVLVSGSFYEILAPISRRIGADALLCTELEVKDGVYTGAMLTQVIGDGKWEVARRYLGGREDIKLEDCYAYGDHLSDVAILEKVGHPVVVGDSTSMLELASQREWRVLAWGA